MSETIEREDGADTKMGPIPTSLATFKEPPINSTNWRLMLCSSRVPPNRLMIDASARVNGSVSRPISVQVFWSPSHAPGLGAVFRRVMMSVGQLRGQSTWSTQVDPGVVGGR